MDVSDISPQLDRLDGEIDVLEAALQPLLGANVADTASKLPLLDKAKLYVLVTYSLESILFSSLRLNEVDAKNHPVFKELTRVRQYFEKIKNIETPAQKPDQSLNKEAAIRFIRADLADNRDVNSKLSEMIAKERAIAHRKKNTPPAAGDEASSKAGEKRKADDPAASIANIKEDAASDSNASVNAQSKGKKKQRWSGSRKSEAKEAKKSGKKSAK